jgi:hypothetical protein
MMLASFGAKLFDLSAIAIRLQISMIDDLRKVFGFNSINILKTHRVGMGNFENIQTIGTMTFVTAAHGFSL